MPHFHTENLNILANWMESHVPDDRFNYAIIIGSNWQGHLDWSCGTSGCAIGWGSTCPALQAQGLVPMEEHRSNEFVGSAGADLWKNAKRIFRLTSREMQYLFQPESYDEHSGDTLNPLPNGATNAQVVAHIRDFIECGGVHRSDNEYDNENDRRERKDLYGE